MSGQSIEEGLLSWPAWFCLFRCGRTPTSNQSLSWSLTTEKTSWVKWWEGRGETALWDGGRSAFGALSPSSGIVAWASLFVWGWCVEGLSMCFCSPSFLTNVLIQISLVSLYASSGIDPRQRSQLKGRLSDSRCLDFLLLSFSSLCLGVAALWLPLDRHLQVRHDKEHRCSHRYSIPDRTSHWTRQRTQMQPSIFKNFFQILTKESLWKKLFTRERTHLLSIHNTSLSISLFCWLQNAPISVVHLLLP